MAVISARSPFIVEINETGQTASKVELRIWNGIGSAPTSPTYTLQKNIPSATNLRTTYNISSFIREYLEHLQPSGVTSQTINTTNEWCNVQVKRYKIVNSTTTLLNTTVYTAYDGYNEYTEGYNYNHGYITWDEGTYYYPVGVTNAGSILIDAQTNWTVKYTNLNTGASFTGAAMNNRFYDIPCLYTTYASDGNKVEIFEGATLQKTFYFKPQDPCLYTPVVVDFINRGGGWQRTYFFKASYDTFNVENTNYNLLQGNLVNYDVKEGQRKSFNTIGKQTIKVNSDWVREDYKNVIKQLMMSERILVDNKPAILNTKSIDLMKHLNQNMINYQMEFEYAYDINTTVV